MISGLENEWAWWIGGAIIIFVAFLLQLFNKHKVGAGWERWERASPYVHAFTYGILFALIAASWRGMGRELEFLAFGFIAAVHFFQGSYFLLNRNKPVDTSPDAKRRRAVLGALWAFALLLPLAWTIVLAARGVEIEDMAWALSAGFAAAGAAGLFASVGRWTGASRSDAHE